MSTNLTRSAQRFLTGNLTLEDALPTRMPVYVSSVAYLFGVTALSAIVVLVVTGATMALFGPEWYHGGQAPGSGVGLFVNSIHFWSAQLLFFALIAHVATKYAMAAWRDGRWRTWIVGALAFGAAIFTALTGFLAQTNWDSQWIAVQAKDALNSVGIGAFFNTMNVGQVLTVHVVALPLLLTLLVGFHLFFIRRDGPVKPIDTRSRDE
ncbi:MAG: cytochrome b N-terminal domain-containing protein [Dehalococcoidia bacterium]|jgi:ubiquinol-cytochrome c reductase cytochrome b subunit